MTSRSTSVIRFTIKGDRWKTTECFHDLAAFLRAGLNPEPSITQNLYSFARHRHNTQQPWSEIIAAYLSVEGLEEGVWANTYDHANLLSPGARYVQVDDLIILQAHNGKDVRSGYGNPRCFRDPHDWLYQNGEAVLAPERDQTIFWFTTDAGETWRAGGAYPDLHTIHGSREKKERGKGKVLVLNGRAYCPVTGAPLVLSLPKLRANFCGGKQVHPAVRQ